MNGYFIRGMRALSLIAVIIAVAGYTNKWSAAGSMASYIFWSVLDGKN